MWFSFIHQTLDVDAEINKTNVDLSGITIYPDSLKTQLDDLRAAVNINFQSFYDEVFYSFITKINLVSFQLYCKKQNNK